MRKKVLIGIVALAVASALCGCGRNTPRPPPPTPVRMPSVTPVGITTVSPGKTATQDTAGAVTKLPEAATAANTVDGTLAP